MEDALVARSKKSGDIYKAIYPTRSFGFEQRRKGAAVPAQVVPDPLPLRRPRLREGRGGAKALRAVPQSSAALAGGGGRVAEGIALI